MIVFSRGRAGVVEGEDIRGRRAETPCIVL